MASLWAGGQAISPLEDDSYGYRLPGTVQCEVWWCESPYKVGQLRGLPLAGADGVVVEAAGNEYEAFQLVLRPSQPLSNVVVFVSDLVLQDSSRSALLSATNVTVARVDYVPVVQSSDSYTFPGMYPDPPVPVHEPLHLAPGTSQPLWVTVYVPPHQPAGDYHGVLQVHGEPDFHLQVPLLVRVFRFTLSSISHTPTAYYADVHINGAVWHRLETLEQQRQVWDLYLDNFRRHRVNPYSPHLYAPFGGLLSKAAFSWISGISTPP